MGQPGEADWVAQRVRWEHLLGRGEAPLYVGAC